MIERKEAPAGRRRRGPWTDTRPPSRMPRRLPRLRRGRSRPAPGTGTAPRRSPASWSAELREAAASARRAAETGGGGMSHLRPAHRRDRPRLLVGALAAHRARHGGARPPALGEPALRQLPAGSGARREARRPRPLRARGGQRRPGRADHRPPRTATPGCSTAGRSGPPSARSPTSSWSSPSATARPRPSLVERGRPGLLAAAAPGPSRHARLDARRDPLRRLPGTAGHLVGRRRLRCLARRGDRPRAGPLQRRLGLGRHRPGLPRRHACATPASAGSSARRCSSTS